MIIGNGDLASVLPKRDDLVFFASGVSNSQETNEDEYNRESTLLMQQDKNKHLVYFSSLAVFYSDTRYMKHKRLMEDTVRSYFEPYTIVRIGNITFGKNPNTVINFLKNKIKNEESYEVRDEYKYVVDKDEFLYWINLIPKWSAEVNIPGRRMKVADIVEEIKTGKL